MEMNNEKDGFLYFDGDFDLPTKMIQQIEDLPDRRLGLVEKKGVYEQRMYSLVLRQLNPIQKGVQTTHSVVEYANNYGCDKEYRQWAETDKTLIILDGGTFQEMEDIYESLKEWGVKFAKFQEQDLNYLTTAITFLVDERVWNRVLYPSWENLPQYPLVIDGNAPAPDSKDYISYNEYVEIMGGAVNVDLRKLIFSKKLSM